jgi:hypothetical protein
MRPFVWLGFLATAACGVDLGGLGPLQDAAEARDTTSMGDDAGSRDDGGGGDAGAAISDANGSDASDSGGSDRGAEATVSSDATRVDGPAATDEGGLDGPSTSDGPSLCTTTIPSGWTVAIYDLNSNPCPANFTIHDISGQPTVGSAACSCTCSVAQPATCAQGTLSVTSGSPGAPCTSTGFSKALTGSGCTVLGVSLSVTGPHSDQAIPLTAQGGVCTDTVQSDPTQVTAAAGRYCDVPAAHAESVCSGTVPSGFAACIATGGQTACPSGTPFVHSYVVEDSVTLQCAPCSACTLMTTCSNAILRGFSDSMCRSPVGSVPVDGGCNPVMLYNYPASVLAVDYTATAASTCTPGTSTPTAQPTNPRTLCCR